MYRLRSYKKIWRKFSIRQNPTLDTNPIKICILGGGFAGLYTALHLHKFYGKKSKNCQITLVNDKDHFLFTPLLYELVTYELEAWEIAPSFDKLFSGTNIHFCQGEIQDVVLETREVFVNTADNIALLTYDYLVLAVGRETNFDSIPGAEAYSCKFRTLADVECFKSKLRSLKISQQKNIQIAIVGGGPNGVELACKLAERLKERGSIFIIERGKQILKTFPAQVRASAQKALANHGVRVNLETTVDTVEANKITLIAHEQFKTLPVDLVFWTAGTQSIKWVSNLACQHNSQGQLFTLPTLQLVNYPEVFALGDLAAIQDTQGNLVPTTAQAAFQQAKCAARNIWAAQSGQSLRRFQYLPLGEMLTLGIKTAVVYSFGLNLEGSLACIVRRLVYLDRLPTLRHRLHIIRHWLIKTTQKVISKLGKFIPFCNTKIRGDFMSVNPSVSGIDQEYLNAVLIFDGVCNLCNTFVNFVIANDPKMHFKFTSNQSEIGQALLQKFNFSTVPETVILIESGHCYTHSTAVLKVLRRLNGFWPILYNLKLIPRPIRDTVYRWVAQNRYKWMGKTKTCRVPTGDLQQRFLK